MQTDLSYFGYDINPITTKPKYEQKIFDTYMPANVGISLWDYQTLQIIKELSGPLTHANEYQLHYWALNLRTTMKDGSILDISIPTLFFNYAQEVSPAHIEFELKDVEAVSKALSSIQSIEINKLLPLVRKAFPYTEAISVALNTLHRHPGGRSQSFSSTDLRKDHISDTGIVFPLAEADIQASFSSIISHVNNEVYLAHSEYRIASGSKETAITYYKGRSAAIVKDSISYPSAVEEIFGITPVDNSYIVYDNLSYNDMLDQIVTAWKTIDYQPNLDNIISSNVKPKEYTKLKQISVPINNYNLLHVDSPKLYNTAILELNRFSDSLNLIHPREIAKLKLKDLIDYMFMLESYYYESDDVDTYEDLDANTVVELQDIIIEEYMLEYPNTYSAALM